MTGPLGADGSASKSPTPVPASWWESPSKQSDNQKKNYGTDGGDNDCANHSAANVDAQ
jgi:hypothetical protein